MICVCVAMGLVGGGGSPPPGPWLCMLSPAGWLPRVRDQLRPLMLDIYEYGYLYLFYLLNTTYLLTRSLPATFPSSYPFSQYYIYSHISQQFSGEFRRWSFGRLIRGWHGHTLTARFSTAWPISRLLSLLVGMGACVAGSGTTHRLLLLLLQTS